jgi:hypothetical protein
MALKVRSKSTEWRFRRCLRGLSVGGTVEDICFRNEPCVFSKFFYSQLGYSICVKLQERDTWRSIESSGLPGQVSRLCPAY